MAFEEVIEVLFSGNITFRTHHLEEESLNRNIESSLVRLVEGFSGPNVGNIA
jgi:hypothetical protein